MMKRKSFLLIIIAVFWVSYILLSFGQTLYTTAERKEANDITRLKRVEHLLSVAQTLVMTGNIEALKEHFDGAVEIDLINYYCILLAPDIGWTHLLRRLSVVDKLTRELFYEAIYT